MLEASTIGNVNVLNCILKFCTLAPLKLAALTAVRVISLRTRVALT